MRHETLAVMLTDIKGFTTRTATTTRDEAARLVHEHERLLRPLIHRFDGNIVKSIGDAFLVTFRSPTNALLCAQAIQDKLWRYNRSVEKDERIEVRVAVSLGEVRVERRDVFGDAVNVASRVESLTPPGEIWFTQTAYLAMNRQEVAIEDLGKRELKGVPEPVRLYRVQPQTKGDRTAPFGSKALEQAEAPWRRRLIVLGAATAAAVVLAIGASVFLLPRFGGAPEPNAEELEQFARQLDGNPDRSERVSKAMEAFRRARASESERLLVSLVENHAAPWAAANAARLLIERGVYDRVDARQLERLLARDPRDPLARAAQQALVVARRDWVQANVEPWLTNADYNVRHAAAEILRQRGVPIDPVRVRLNDLRLPAGCPDKLEAARALADLTPFGRAALRDLATDPPAGVRACPEVQSYLSRFGGGPATSAAKKRPGPLPVKKRR